MRNSTFALVRTTIIAACVPALIVGVAACHRDAGAASNAQSGTTADASGPDAQLKTLPADTNPCGWVTADEVARKLGPLSGAPWRADHAESPEPDEKGRACVYPLAAHGRLANDETKYWVAIELLSEDATVTDASKGMAHQMVANLSRGMKLDSGSEKGIESTLGTDRKVASGWDNTFWLPGSFTGRLGGIAVQVQSNFEMFGPNIPSDSIENLAAMVRDRIPDIPIASPRASRHFGFGGRTSNACKLITRAEAETVLGKLTVPPFPAASDDLADPSGEECSYYTGKHRVLTIAPTWQNGKMLFRMVAGLNQGVSNAIGMQGESADTLDGPWDQVGGGTGGVLYFLKGDRMLEVDYGTASVDAGAALKLARIALKRLDAE